MAAPPSIDLRSLSGKWVMNKSLSDSTDGLLRLQGLGIITRKTLRMSLMSLVMDQSAETPIQIKTTNKANGLSVSEESITLDDVPRDTHDATFGDVKITAKWVDVNDIQDNLLNEGKWDESTVQTKAIEESWDHPKAGWTSKGIWGFENIDGKRYHVRRYWVKKGAETKFAKTVWDYAASN